LDRTTGAVNSFRYLNRIESIDREILMFRLALFCLPLFVFISATSAQIIYEPVQYQYSAGGTNYYYGGSDLRVHALAQELHSTSGSWGRVNGFAFVSGDAWTHREVDREPLRVFTDALPLRNAGDYGFTVNDARNEANANMPRYFVKRDLLAAAVAVDGTWVVPAQAEPIKIYKSNGVMIERPPLSMPRPLMIIPKDALKKSPASDKQLVSAD
jgi:hypothetical protein